MIKHIVFDFDGTIADSLEIAMEIYNEFSIKYKYKKVNIEDVRRLFSLPIKPRLKKVGIPLYKVPQILIDATLRYKQLIKSLKTFDHILDLLKNLKNEGYTLSIISSNSVDNISNFLRNNEIALFDNVISSNNLFGKDKTLKKYLKQFSLTAKEVIYVGDELRDIESCKKISVKMIAVTWGYDPIELLKSGEPDYIVSDPMEIGEVIKNLIK